MTGTYPTTTLHFALDQGGHSSRALIFDNRGQLRAAAETEIETFRFRDERVEHDPEELIHSLISASQEALTQVEKQASIRNAGLATQRASIVCWDRVTGQALSNVISWQDRRGADWITSKGKFQNLIHTKTGLMLSPHYGMSKLRWCLNNIPAVGDSMARGRLAWGPLASFLLHRLLKEHPLLVDPVNASRTLLWDLETRDWSPQLLDLFKIPSKPLPRCVPSRFNFGHLEFTNQAIPVAVATGDQSAALFALGVPKKDIIYVNVGTGAFVQQICGKSPVIAPKLLSSVVFEDEYGPTYALEGTVNGAGNAVGIMAEKYGMTLEQVMTEADQWVAEIEEPPLFVNGVSGLGSPYWQPNLKSEMVGKGGLKQEIVAVIESIAFLININVHEIAKHLPRPEKIVITGGLSSLDGLCQKLADLTELRVERPRVTQATARGLAYLTSQSDQWVPLGPVVGFPVHKDSVMRQRFSLWKQLVHARIAEN